MGSSTSEPTRNSYPKLRSPHPPEDHFVSALYVADPDHDRDHVDEPPPPPPLLLLPLVLLLLPAPPLLVPLLAPPLPLFALAWLSMSKRLLTKELSSYDAPDAAEAVAAAPSPPAVLLAGPPRRSKPLRLDVRLA